MARQDQTIRYSVEVDGAPALKSVADGLNAIAQAGGPAGEQATALLEKLKEFASQDTLIKQFVSDKAALADLGDQMNATGTKLNALKDKFAATTTPSAALSKSIANTEASLVGLSTQFGAQQAQLAKTGNALEAAGVDTKNLDAAQRAVQSSIAGVATQAGALGANLGTASKATEEAGVAAEKSGSLFATLGQNLGAIVTIAAAVSVALKAIQFADTSIKGAEDVEASLARVQALAAGAAGQFEELDKAVEAAAIAVNTTTTNAAGGLAALVAQGLNANDAISALIPTLQLAKIANIDVGTAAGEVATVLKSFNIPASEAASAVDELVAASHGAAGGLGAMSEAIGQLAPDAKTLGLSFTDITGILGLLVTKGIAVGNSVRGLRTVFQDLQNPTSELRVQLLGLGDGTSSFASAITALNSKTPQAAQALNGLAGPARALVETLGQAGPGALAAFTSGLQNATGAASATSQAIDQTLSGSFSKFTNAIDLVGEKLAAPILQPFADEFTKLAGQLNEFAESDDFKAISDAVGKMATDASKALDGLITGTDWKGFASNAESSLSNLSKTLQTLADNATTVAKVVGKSADAIGVAYHGVAVIYDGVISAGAKLVDTVTTLAEKGDALSEGTKTASDNFEKLHAAFESVGDEAADQAGKNISALKDDALELAGASNDAADGINKEGEAATNAAPGVTAHAKATQDAATYATALAAALEPVPDYLDAAGAAAAAAVPPMANFNDQVQVIGGGALTNAKLRLDDATAAFAKLQGAADATPEALEHARQAVIQASADLQKLSSAANTSADTLRTAFKELGITSQASLQQTATAAKAAFDAIDKGSANTAAGLADKQNAFLAYAKTALAASAQLSDGQKQAVQENLDQQASVLGVSDALKTLEDQSAKSTVGLVSDADRYSASLDALGEKAHEQALAFIAAGNAANYASDQSDDFGKRTSKAADQASDSLKGTGESAQSLNQQIADIGTGGFPDLSQALANTRAELLSVSDAAAKAFDTKLLGDFDIAFDATGAGFSRVIDAMNEASASVTQTIADQRDQLQAQIDLINQIGTAGATNFGEFGNSADAATAKMNELATAIQNGSVDAGLLGQQELIPLQQALEAAAQRAQALSAQFKQTAQDLQDAVDQAEGNTTDLENRRFQQQLADLKSQAQAAGDLNTQQYNQAVANANKLHALNLANIAAEKKAQSDDTSTPSGAQTQSGGAGAGSPGGIGTSSAADDSGSGGAGLGGTGGGGSAPISFIIHVAGSIIGGTPDQIAQGLTALVLPQLKSLQARSTTPILGSIR